MHSAFGLVVIIVIVAAVLIGLACTVAGRRTWEDYGKGGMTMGRSPARPAGQAGPPAVAERDEEIRQMLEARNARRRRRGETAVDVELELARLTQGQPGPTIDAGLREEIRELVVARNHRRARRGEPPLDVEAEVEREITRLGGV